MNNYPTRIILGISFFILFAPAAHSAEVLSLDDCIRLALKNNSDIIQSHYALQRAELSVKRSFSSLFPNISTSASGSSGGPFFSKSSSQWNWSLSGTINKQIYKPALYTGIQLSKVQEDISRLSDEEWVLRVRSLVEKMVCQILTSQILIGVYEENIRLSDEQIRKVRTMVDLGLRRESDLLKSEVQRGTFETKLINEEQNLASLKRELNILMGNPSENEWILIPIESFQVDLPDFESSLQILSESNPTLKAMGRQVRANEISLNMAKEAYLPSVSATYSYSRNEDAFSGDYVDTDQIAVKLSVDIFDGFDKHLNIQQQKIGVDDTRVEFDAVRRELHRALNDQYTALEVQEKLIAILEKTLESAQKDLEVVSQQYAQGFASILDLMDAQVSTLESETDLIKARFARKIIESEIRQLLGV